MPVLGLLALPAAAVMTAAPAFAQAAPQAPPAQTPPPTQTPPKTTAPTTPTPPPKTPSRGGQSSRAAAAAAQTRSLVLTVQVTNTNGQSQDGVKVIATGPVPREGVTDAAGLARLSGIRPGNYRLHLEREGLITLEKEVTVGKESIAVDATMTEAPKPPPPPPAPAPTATPLGTPGEPRVLSLSDYIEKNLIGREPQKQSVVGCSGVLRSVLLQVRDPLAEQTDDQLDQTIYVVAGQGTLKLAGRDNPLVPASFAVIPRGTPYGLTRRGNTPLIVLLTRANEPCSGASARAR